MKTCTKCKGVYPATIEYFCKDSTKIDSLHSHCKCCSKKSKAEYHAKISPELKRKRAEARSLYFSSEEYRAKHEESKIKDRDRKNRWSKNNRDKVNAAARIYNATKRTVSKEKSKEYKQREYVKLMSCPYKKAIHCYRVRINDVLNGRKSFKTGDVILFSREQFISHIESLFRDGMNWDNHGEWHIDHIKPVASFDLTIKEQVVKCWSLSNLQPLWRQENLMKGTKSNYFVSISSPRKSSPL